MMGAGPLILDGAILFLLGVTIFLAARLSLQLKKFSDSRSAMEALVRDLSQHIDKAGEAISGLRNGVENARRNMDDRIDEARALADELQIILKSGNNLATRIERMIDKSAQERTGSFVQKPGGEKPQPFEPSRNQSGPFAIRDRAFEEGESEDLSLREDGTFEEEDQDEGIEKLGSQAERDLFRALRRNKKENA